MEKPASGLETGKIASEAGVSQSDVLAALFPPSVIAAEHRGSIDGSSLYPDERQYAVNAAPNRLREFAAGRACARYALARLGVFDFPLHVGKDRAPCWPASVVGSITHTSSYCGVVVARRTDIKAIGVDAEVVGRVKTYLWAKICTPDEIRWLGTLREPQRSLVATLLFCAKEAFYKCQYPLTRQWLDFHDVFVEPGHFDPEHGLFAVNMTGDMTGRQNSFGTIPLPIHGKFTRAADLLLAGLCLPNTIA